VPFPPTLVLPPRYSDDSVRLWRAAVAREWGVERLHGWQVPDSLHGRDVAIYGETFFVDFTAERLGRVPIGPALDWLTRLPSAHLRRQVGFTSLDAARGTPGRRFWKPADDKLFPARVYEDGCKLPSTEELPGDTPVLWSEPVAWELEYRCFVLDRRVVTLSPYWRGEQLAQAEDGSWPAPDAERDEALAFAGAVLSDPAVDMPEAFVLDVGIITGAGWAVIEANPAWASGLYGCDPSPVLDVLLRATVAGGNPG
jgi:hypothetical protein